MTGEFRAIENPSAATILQLSELEPFSPFHTSGYAEANREIGRVPVLLGAFSGDLLSGGSMAFLSRGRLGASLEIPTAPVLPDPDPFWAGLLKYAARSRVWDLLVESFGSATGSVPALPREVSRWARKEWVIALDPAGAFKNLSTNHRRNIGRAEKAGIEIRRLQGVSPDIIEAHHRLQDASLERRSSRGESVPGVRRALAYLSVLLNSGDADLFQAVQGDVVHSSILVIRSKRAAYYHSGGTSPEGMSLGASPLLIRTAGLLLQRGGIETLNLGSAMDDNPGLMRFKSGFGAHPVDLDAVSASMVSPLMQKARTALKRLVRQ